MINNIFKEVKEENSDNKKKVITKKLIEYIKVQYDNLLLGFGFQKIIVSMYNQSKKNFHDSFKKTSRILDLGLKIFSK